MITLFGGVLRLIGLGFGLPNLYHQDEPIIVNHAMAVGVQGLKMGFYVLPGFAINFLFLILGGYYVIGQLLGSVVNPEGFALSFITDPSRVYGLGRFFLGTLVGTLNIYILGLLGRRFFGASVGLLSALILAVAHVHVQHSHYIYADILLTLSFTICAYLLLSLLEKPKTSKSLYLGIALGWGVSTKYIAVYLLPPIFLTYFFLFGTNRRIRDALFHLSIVGIASLITFGLFSPATILDWKEFMIQIQGQAGVQHYTGAFHHLFYSIGEGVGIGVGLLSILGLVLSLRNHPKYSVVLILAGVTYYGFIVFMGQMPARYVLPLIPFICLFAAMGCLFLLKRNLLPNIFIRLFLVVCLMLTAIPTVYSNYLFLQKDTRTLAQNWIQNNLDAGTVFALENRFYSPHLLQSYSLIQDKYRYLAEGEDGARKKRLDLFLKAFSTDEGFSTYLLSPKAGEEGNGFLFSRPVAPLSFDFLKEIKCEYIILSYLDPDPVIHQFVRGITQHLELVKTFNPYRDNGDLKVSLDQYSTTAAPHTAQELFRRTRLGPYLEIYKVIY